MFIEDYRETSLDRYISIEISGLPLPNTVYLSLLVLFYASVSCITLGLKLKSKTEIIKRFRGRGACEC